MKKNDGRLKRNFHFFILVLLAIPLHALGEEDSNAAYEIAKKNACLGCHALDKKIIGPAFKDIAKKYRGSENADQFLALRIKNGGSGVWGVVAMPANKNMNDQDTKKVIRWILDQK